MRSRYRIAVLVLAASAATLGPMASRAAHPPTLPASAHLAQTPRAGTKGYQFTTFDAPGSSDTEAWGISNTGIVGGFYLIQGLAHGFVWRNGSLTTVDHPGASFTFL